MKEQILHHIHTVKNMELAHVPFTFVREFGEEKCRQVSDSVLENDIRESVETMSEGAKKYFMEDPEMIPYVKRLRALMSDLTERRLESLLAQAGEEKVSAFAFQDVQEVLMDERLPIRVQYNYLKYFKHMNLSEKERFQVYESLEKFGRSIQIDLSQLTEEERKIMINPLFTADLLEYQWNIRDTWSALVHPRVLQLLQKIYETGYSYQLLGKPQFRQISERPEEILELLEKVLAFFSEEQSPEFIEMWLDNESLLADLRKLIRMLPDMEESRKEEILGSRVAYVCSLYQVKMDNLDFSELKNYQKEVLLYAIVAGKKHFLELVDKNSEAFLELPYRSILLDPGIYENYLNLNTLNEKNLREGYSVSTVPDKYRKYLKRGTYTFEELKTLAPLKEVYYQLYGLLTNKRSDDRLRILREVINCGCLPYIAVEEKDLEMLGKRLSEKLLSMWMHREMGHIQGLKGEVSMQLLTEWESYQKYIPGIKNVQQVRYLIRNKEILTKYATLEEFQDHMLEEDKSWQWLKSQLDFSDGFVGLYEDRIREFVYEGEAEIVYQFCRDTESKREEVRRILAAELMGEFHQLKYHEKDLEKEIAYPVSEKTESVWKENLEREEEKCRIWEEDGFIPVLQIGEIPTHTCISYQNGIYKDCLLSCFDANKKVLFAEWNGKMVFRALIRLTKGSRSSKPEANQRIEFVDLTKEPGSGGEDPEELVLFLERPYFSGINEIQRNNIVSLAYQLVYEKAKKLYARVVISQSYKRYEISKNYEEEDYYIYISASKNGNQYLDSLCGEATVNRSGMYGKNRFLMMEGSNVA